MKRARRLTQCLIKPLLQHLTQGRIQPLPRDLMPARARSPLSGQNVIPVPQQAAWLLLCGSLLLTGCGGGKNSKLAAADATEDSPANL